jgi:hypothetical protein
MALGLFGLPLIESEVAALLPQELLAFTVMVEAQEVEFRLFPKFTEMLLPELLTMLAPVGTVQV